ncbi:hypothetical protein C2G38_358885 [Gigaspora rosea]|uniref:Uncharacterized protein n=1 Tax=Gigaspora rosea TaxID=44941 RepID=A0A397UMG4_9GLOM|nr:hypothetical protein C2G38_358885 [Gigaspora rosea]
MDSFTKPTKCFFCVPLRAGVIMITILWLVESLGLSSYYLSVLRQNNEYYKNRIFFVYVLLLYAVTVALVSIFGLITIKLIKYLDAYRKRVYLIRLYSILSNIIASVSILLNSLGIISAIYSYEQDKAMWIIINITDIFISAHFAFVIAAYAARHSSTKEHNHSISKSHGIEFLN